TDRPFHDGPDNSADNHRADDNGADDGAHDDGTLHDRADDDRSGHTPDDDRAAHDHRADDDGAGDGADHDRQHDDDHPRHHVRALYYGTYDPEHPRNVNAIAALREAGVEVVERQASVRRTGVRGALSVFAAESRLLAPRHRDFDVLIVGYPGHFDVPRARRLAGT